MKRTSFLLVLLLACGLLRWAERIVAADTPANVAGTWEMTAEEGHQQHTLKQTNGPMTQTLTIQQDATTIKGTLSGQRGDTPFRGTVAGNQINFIIKRVIHTGTLALEYSATVDGDSMTGTIYSQSFIMGNPGITPPRMRHGKFTAKRRK